MNKIHALAGFLAGFFFCCGIAFGQKVDTVPLPQDIKMVLPSDSLPANVRAFAGKWAGVWDDKLSFVLVVEEIKAPNDVTVVYAHGTYDPWRITQVGHYRLQGKIDAGVLAFSPRPGQTASYEFHSSGDLRGTYEIWTSARPYSYRTAMKRMRD